MIYPPLGCTPQQYAEYLFDFATVAVPIADIWK